MEILPPLLHVAMGAVHQYGSSGTAAVWKWAYLKFSIMGREVVSIRLRNSDEQKKLWQRSISALVPS